MREVFFGLMSNVYNLAVILIFLVLLGGYCLLPSGYYWLLLVTDGYCSFPLLVWTKKLIKQSNWNELDKNIQIRIRGDLYTWSSSCLVIQEYKGDS